MINLIIFFFKLLCFFFKTRNCTTNTTATCNSCWETAYQSYQVQQMNCTRDPCPYCSWTNTTVSACSATCNTGFQLSTRQCVTVDNQPCGTCDGSDVISQVCSDLPACPGVY